jgi:thymidylate synthase
MTLPLHFPLTPTDMQDFVIIPAVVLPREPADMDEFIAGSDPRDDDDRPTLVDGLDSDEEEFARYLARKTIANARQVELDANETSIQTWWPRTRQAIAAAAVSGLIAAQEVRDDSEGCCPFPNGLPFECDTVTMCEPHEPPPPKVDLDEVDEFLTNYDTPEQPHAVQRGVGVLKRRKSTPPPVIRFYRMDKSAKIPVRGSPYAAGLDVFAPKGGRVTPFHRVLVHLKLKVCIPTNHYLRVAGRSSLALRGINVLAGVIDEDFRGELGIILVNHGSEDYNFKAGERIAQIICEKISYPSVVEDIDDPTIAHSTQRGEGGWGSSDAVADKPSAKIPRVSTSQTQAPPTAAIPPRIQSIAGDTSHWQYQPQLWETCYWRMVDKILYSGELRTGASHGTCLGIFKPFDFHINLEDGKNYPLLRSRRVSFKTMAAELLWFLTGSCLSQDLEAMKCKIWRGNTRLPYLRSRGLGGYIEGETGPMYGFQWRHFGAEYKGPHADYNGCGVDQISQLIHRLRTRPTDRGHVLAAYNPAQKAQQCVTTCHVYAQFYVSSRGTQLDMAVVQRSVDVALGLPFNIASYALLLMMVARVVGLRAGNYYHSCMDTHIYKDHIAAMSEYSGRFSKIPFPDTFIPAGVHVPVKGSMDEYRLDDFELYNYHPLEDIAAHPMNMTV